MEVITRNTRELRIGTTVIDLTEKIGGCQCRNNRQRLAALRLAQTIFSGQMIQHTRGNAPLPHRVSQRTNRMKLSELLRGHQICMECVRNALLITGDFRGESYELCALNALNPLPVKRCRKK